MGQNELLSSAQTNLYHLGPGFPKDHLLHYEEPVWPLQGLLCSGISSVELSPHEGSASSVFAYLQEVCKNEAVQANVF